MRNSNGNGYMILVLWVLGLAALMPLAVCSFSMRGITIHAIDTYATTEARPPTVGERAADIRDQTRLDGQTIPTGFWLLTLGLTVIGGGSLVYLFQGEKLHKALAESKKQQRLLQRGGPKAPAPARLIEYPQHPTAPFLPPGQRYLGQPPGGDDHE